MSLYNTTAEVVNPEIVAGYQAVIDGRYSVNGAVSIRDYADTPLREASPYETIGIMRALGEIAAGTLTAYSQATRRSLHASADLALAVTLADLSDEDFDALADHITWKQRQALASFPIC